MGDVDRMPPGNGECHAHAAETHPQSTSSTMTAILHVRVRGLGAFPATTEVARTIASMHGMCGVEPPGRVIAASAPNTGGVSFVHSYSCVHAETSHRICVAVWECEIV